MKIKDSEKSKRTADPSWYRARWLAFSAVLLNLLTLALLGLLILCWFKQWPETIDSACIYTGLVSFLAAGLVNFLAIMLLVIGWVRSLKRRRYERKTGD